MRTKVNNWVTLQAANKSYYNFYFCVSLLSLIFFMVAFGIYIYSITNYHTDLDNSGMGLIILVPPVIMTLLLFFASSLSRFYYLPKNIKIDNAVFVIMGLLTIPVTLFGLSCFDLIIRFSVNKS